jgi:hypothetical protein
VVPHRWSGSVLTEWWQSTGGGRGSRRWSQFGRWTLEMAGPRRVAGFAAVRSSARPTGIICKGKKVCHACGEVAELRSYTNLTRTQQRGEGGSSLEMKMMAALAQSSSGKGGEVAEAGVRSWGARGGPFIGGRGGGGRGWRADSCRGGNDGAQWRQRDGSGRRGDRMARAGARR